MRQRVVLLHHSQDAEQMPNLLVEIFGQLFERGDGNIASPLLHGNAKAHAGGNDVAQRLKGAGQQHERIRLDFRQEQFVQMFDLLEVSAGLDGANQLLVFVFENVDLNVILKVIDEERHGVAQMPNEGIFSSTLQS